MNRTLLAVLLAPLILMTVGCAAEERAYQVGLRNNTSTPVTVWLYKDGGPYENGWKSPEDMAIESPKAGTPVGGIIVPPGKLAFAGPISGKFDPQTNAILRVYRGAHSFNELLAIGHDSEGRQEVKLDRGRNSFTIVDRAGKIAVDRVSDLPETEPR